MQGLMMNTQLTITEVMRLADKVYGSQEIVSVTSDNAHHKYTYKEAFSRVRQLANALKKMGAKEGDTIGTLAWNDYRHLELYYAISCSGMICHTVNPRLFEEQLEYIVNHAEDQYLFVDLAFVSLLEKIQDKFPNVKGFIVLTDEANMPNTSLKNVQCYESLIGDELDLFDWPQLDENLASALCYTSGTTGNPKGVLYSHRSTILHSYASALPDAFNLSVTDTVMPIVPMFHVNGWGLVYSALMIGSKVVFPGPKMGDGETLCKLINKESVTLSAGVPTVWLALLEYLNKSGDSIDSLQRIGVGGAACPLSIMTDMEEKHGVWVQHAWGMTEMSPLGTYNSLKPGMELLAEDELNKVRLKTGRPLFGVDLKIEGPSGEELPWNGVAAGSLKVRGPWVVKQYFKQDKPAVDENGWFETGDVATIDSDGYMNITDRTKDVIKSGGEWISSIELENCAVNHPKVMEAAVVGIPHPKWSERPLLLVILKEGEELSKEDMLSWFDGKVAKWWTPADCVFVTALPHTATGKLSKKDIRKEYQNFQWND